MRSKLILTAALAIGLSISALTLVSANPVQQTSPETTIQPAAGSVLVQDTLQGGSLQAAGWVQQ